MKTNNTILKSAWLFLLAAPLVGSAQTRDVDWIHGFGGGAPSWENVQNGYQNANYYLGMQTRTGYITNSGIPYMGNHIRTSNTGGSNKISIAHSMGGTAVRDVDLSYPTHWAGNLTVGAPLRGAKLAPATQNGSTQAFINHGIDELMRGPSVGSNVIIFTNPAIGIGISAFGGIIGKHSNDIAGAIVDAIKNSLGFTSPSQTVDDLNPNGSYMSSVVNQGTSTPKINIWGNEDNPILWRVASSYGADGDDQPGVNAYNDAVSAYQVEANTYNTLSYVFFPFWGLHQWKRRCWQRGADWIRDESNAAWRVLVGAGYTVSQQVQVLEYDFQCGDQAQFCDGVDPNCNDEACLQWVTRTVDAYVPDFSDGIVPGYSARNEGGAWRGHIVEAQHINHREMLVYDKIKYTLNPIFDGSNTNGQTIFTIGH